MFDLSSVQLSVSTKEAFNILYEYWDEIRKGKKIPRKSDFNPMKIKSILAETAIMERIDEDTVVYRLAGTALTERAGMDLTGINTLKTFPEYIREDMSSAYRKSAEKPCAGYHKVISNYAENTSFQLDCLYLPMSDNDGVARYHIVLMYIANKDDYRVARFNRFFGYKVPAIHYLDIGCGSLETDVIADHNARFD